MLKRKVYQELLKWKENTEGKALCIIGARQIGKTTLIREFGKNEYEHFAEINFYHIFLRAAGFWMLAVEAGGTAGRLGWEATR